jgi:catechol 2,3-dioxygenase-like lactoylglutathione lyase family enzyme
MLRLNHLALPVRDPEASARFWCGPLGFSPGRRAGDVRFLHDRAGFDLALHPADAATLPAPFHLGFRLGSVTEVEQVHDRLMRAGVELSEPLTEESTLAFFRVRDPDGHELEFYWEDDADA